MSHVSLYSKQENVSCILQGVQNNGVQIVLLSDASSFRRSAAARATLVTQPANAREPLPGYDTVVLVCYGTDCTVLVQRP